MSTIIVFVSLGLQVKWNQLSSNNSHYTSCIHKGLHAGKWSDLMASKPDFLSTLGYHWTGHAIRTLEPQVRWDATGTTLADASTQWCPSGDPVLIFIIGAHWKATGRPLEAHWIHQCTLGSKFQVHGIATELPLAQGKDSVHWTGGSANVRDAVDLRRHCAHCNARLTRTKSLPLSLPAHISVAENV